MEPFEYLLLFAGVMAAGVLLLRFTLSPSALKLMLAFSGAFLFSICIMEIMPEIYGNRSTLTGVLILAGFLLQILIEYFSKGIEHGHAHIHHQGHKRFPLTMMLALSVHSLLEGIPLAGDWHDQGHLHRSLLAGIIMHNIPVSFALVLLLKESGLSRARILLWLAFFAFMTPLGAFAASRLSPGLSGNLESFFPGIMAIVAGIFLHISTTILFESSDNHRFNLLKLAIILLGMILGVYL